jgi:hypothetical protein
MRGVLVLSVAIIHLHKFEAVWAAGKSSRFEQAGLRKRQELSLLWFLFDV